MIEFPSLQEAQDCYNSPEYTAARAIPPDRSARANRRSSKAWNKPRPRRSALYVPADNARALEKASGLDVDVLILDLEDAVAPDAKDAARDALARCGGGVARPARSWSGSMRWTRRTCEDDLKAALAARPDAILLPKVGNADDIEAAPRWRRHAALGDDRNAGGVLNLARDRAAAWRAWCWAPMII